MKVNIYIILPRIDTNSCPANNSSMSNLLYTVLKIYQVCQDYDFECY